MTNDYTEILNSFAWDLAEELTGAKAKTLRKNAEKDLMECVRQAVKNMVGHTIFTVYHDRHHRPWTVESTAQFVPKGLGICSCTIRLVAYRASGIIQ